MPPEERPGLTIRVVAAVITRQGRYLITQRRASAVLPLAWEFPGGRVEPGESNEAALCREVQHRLGMTVTVGALIGFITHPYERYAVDLYLYECSMTSGEPREVNVHAFAWAASEDFERYRFTPADERSMSLLLGLDESQGGLP